jgi:hypothetical protein
MRFYSYETCVERHAKRWSTGVPERAWSTIPFLRRTEVSITIIPPSGSGEFPLLLQWPTGASSLPAFMALDPENGDVWFGNSVGNARPFAVIKGLWFWWSIHPRTTRKQAVDLAEELIPQLERVCVGHSVGWDGRNRSGGLDADAQLARAEIRERLWSTFGWKCVAQMSTSIKG